MFSAAFDGAGDGFFRRPEWALTECGERCREGGSGKGWPMTELELTVDFVRVFADLVVTAVKSGERLDERREFAKYCDDLGTEPTAERLDLARDVALVMREHFWQPDDGEPVDGDDLSSVPSRLLADGLERHGWRREFLMREVGG